MSDTTDTIYVDPVCGYKISTPKNSTKIVHNGANYFFCSKKCSVVFRKNPEKYASNTNLNPLTIRKKVTSNLENSDLIFKQLILKLSELDINSLINIQTILCRNDGIIDVNINSGRKNIIVKYNPDLISEVSIREVLSKSGLKIKNELQETVIFFIENFFYTSVSGGLEEKLNNLDGVIEAVVNIATEEIIVRFNPEEINSLQIQNFIIRSGKKAIDLKDIKTLQEIKIKREKESNFIKKNILLSFLISVVILLLSIDNYFFKLPEKTDNTLLIFLLASIVQVLGGGVFYKNFIFSLKEKIFNYNSLIVIGISSAYIYSILNLSRNFSEQNTFYIPSVLILVFLITYYLALFSREKFSGTLERLLQSYPEKIKVIKNNEINTEYINNIQVEDIIEIDPEQLIFFDSVIIDGKTEISENSVINTKIKGDNLISGSFNKGETIKVQVTKEFEKSRYFQKLQSFEVSLSSKTILQKQIESLNYYYPLFIFFLTSVTFISWNIFSGQLHIAFLNAINIIAVSSTFLFTIATGYPYIIGMKKAREYGFLCKNTESFSILNKVNTVYLNKSGVLTQSKPIITDIVTYNGYDGNTVLKIAASVENHSESVLGKAIVHEAKSKNFNLWMPKDFNFILGMGIEANVNGYNVLIGSKQLMRLKSINIDTTLAMAKKLTSEGKTLIYISIKNNIAGIIAISDSIAEGSGKFIEKLKRIVGDIYLFTGDTKKTSVHLAEQVGINTKNILAELTPAEKIKKIENYKKNGKAIALITKKVNYDDPVFKSPDIILNLDGNNDKEAEVNYIKYLNNDPDKIITSFNLSKRINRTIKQNLLWLFVYLLISLPVAGGLLSLFNIQVDPIIASLASAISLVFLLIHSINLYRVKNS